MSRRSKPLKFDNHRKPPKPESWNIERGNCRFCGGPIVENGKVNRRKHWHQECANRWKIANNPREAKWHVFIRDKGTCQDCGFHSPLPNDFDLDHVKPLFEAEGRFEYYEPENMQLLCKPCHKNKTKEDMKEFRNYDLRRVYINR